MGLWSRKDDQWTVRALHVGQNGEQASAINLITYVDENTFKLKSVGREVDGELMPDIEEVTVVRKQ